MARLTAQRLARVTLVAFLEGHCCCGADNALSICGWKVLLRDSAGSRAERATALVHWSGIVPQASRYIFGNTSPSHVFHSLGPSLQVRNSSLHKGKKSTSWTYMNEVTTRSYLCHKIYANVGVGRVRVMFFLTTTTTILGCENYRRSFE
jgi:hypothetical protein